MNPVIISTLLLLAVATPLLGSFSGLGRIGIIFVLYVFIAILFLTKSVTISELGLEFSSLKKGLCLGLCFMALITVGGIIAYFVAPEAFKDPRYNFTLTKTLFYIFITLPFMTVLLEELLFRGLLFGVLQTHYTNTIAVLVSSFAFGLWHSFSASHVKLSFLPGSLISQQIITVSGVIFITMLAGLFFSWLRLKSGSLIASILVHWALNSTGVLLAYLSFKL